MLVPRSDALRALGVNGDRAGAREAQGRRLDCRLGGERRRRARLLLGTGRARALGRMVFRAREPWP